MKKGVDALSLDVPPFSILTTLWWLSFWTATGLCIGSFLNAVIYRLPRNRSLLNPRWSFCPSCRHRIRWYDNIPLLSFMLLRGRCRSCAVPIATRYVVIEAMMAVVVLMLLDAFFIGRVRGGLSDSVFGLTDRLAYDWPIFLSHILLFACLLPMAAIDLEHYWVDIRFTNFATLGGFVLHAIWTPRHSTEWVRPWDTTAVVALCAVGGLGLVWVVLVCQPHREEDVPDDVPPDTPEPEISGLRTQPPSLASPSRAGGWVAGLLLAALFAILFLDEGGGLHLRHTGRALLPLLLFIALIVRESTVERAADQQIVDAIDQERPFARRMVLSELLVLLPAVIAGFAGWWLMTSVDALPEAVSRALEPKSHGWGFAMLRGWNPLLGLATAASGYVIAGAIGWTVRILFTLVLGKEAFGTGDIHLMAAAGCVAGWPVVVLGFFLTCGLALLGWVAVLPFKRTKALPLGPWLSVSFLTVVVFYDSMLRWPVIQRAVDTVNWFLS